MNARAFRSSYYLASTVPVLFEEGPHLTHLTDRIYHPTLVFHAPMRLVNIAHVGLVVSASAAPGIAPEDMMIEQCTEITPTYTKLEDSMRLPCSKGKLKLARKELAITGSSKVYAATLEESSGEIRSVVVKYMTDCVRRDELMRKLAARSTPAAAKALASMKHPLENEGEFLEIVYNADNTLVPETLILSPSVRPTPLLHRDASERIMSTVLAEKYLYCAGLDSKIRFLVQARAGPDLAKYLGDMRRTSVAAVYMETALRATMLTIAKLEKLHALNIVHGDIHSGNVVLADPAGTKIASESDLLFIDFGYAHTIPSAETAVAGNMNIELLSPWHLEEASPVGQRDDVYRALEMLARALAPPKSFRRGIEDLWKTGGKDAVLGFKREGNLFATCCQGMGLSDAAVGALQVHLDGLVSHVRGYADPTTVPNYDGLVQELAGAIEMVQVEREASAAAKAAPSPPPVEYL